MSLRDLLPEPTHKGPILKIDRIIKLLSDEEADELRELLADNSLMGSSLCVLLNRLCDIHKVPQLKVRNNTVNRYRREQL
jgi:hypothetical protein